MIPFSEVMHSLEKGKREKSKAPPPAAHPHKISPHLLIYRTRFGGGDLIKRDWQLIGRDWSSNESKMLLHSTYY